MECEHVCPANAGTFDTAERCSAAVTLCADAYPHLDRFSPLTGLAIVLMR